jgi:DNA-binding IclR family transcriptional regulator
VTITLYEGPLEDFATKAAQDRQFVVALARGLEILRVFMPGETVLTNSQIAARTKLPKATVSRLTHTLTELGYLTYCQPSRGYKLGDAVIGLGYGVLTGLDISRRARPAMEALAQETGMEISLSRRDRLSMVVIERVALPGSRTYCVSVGSRIPIAATATGRAYLAALTDYDRGYLLSLLGERAPEHLRDMKQGLDFAFDDHRREGYCVSIGEWDSTVTAVAVPIYTPGREVEAVMAGGIPTRFMTEARLRTEIAPRFVRTAARLSRQFGIADAEAVGVA